MLNFSYYFMPYTFFLVTTWYIIYKAKIKEVKRLPNTSILNEEKHSYNEKELLFCQYYVKTHTGTLSAIQAGYSKNSAHVTASRMLKTEKIQALITSIRNETTDTIRAHFLSDALVARQVMYEIMNNPEVTPMVRFQAAKDFLDRTGFRAVEKKEHSENRTINIEFNIPRPSKQMIGEVSEKAVN
jgi:hypothetical protein